MQGQLIWSKQARFWLGPLAILFAAASTSAPAIGQIFSLNREQLLKYTAQNPYERFPDGRPKVPDAMLDKIREMSAEEILPIVRRGYPNQYVDGLQILAPGKTMVGRAVTLQLIPSRPDVADVLQADAKARGLSRLTHQTAIDLLQKGDVFVVDSFGDLNVGGIIGDNLAYYIWKTTGVGFVIDGPIRDLDGISPIGMSGYYRGAVPPAITNVMVSGINVPVRIGRATVLPGDVVFGDKEGVYFIPPHLVQEIVDEADITHVHDEWTRKKFDEGKYKSTDIYGSPRDPALIREYHEYLKEKVGQAAYDRYLKRMQAAQPRPNQSRPQ